jgi:serine/threonine protein kinase
MVMEYVPGVSLKAHLDDLFVRGERMPVDEVLGLFRALLDAVGYAHAQGMIHRDLKPANVMLEIENAEGSQQKADVTPPAYRLPPSAYRPVLTDFGIAKILGGSTFTASGVTVGTPTYMSPEQGSGEPGDARSDLYALGVVLYECLTGQVPFQGDTSVAVLLKHISAPIPPLRDTLPELPASLSAPSKALAKILTSVFKLRARCGRPRRTHSGLTGDDQHWDRRSQTGRRFDPARRRGLTRHDCPRIVSRTRTRHPPHSSPARAAVRPPRHSRPCRRRDRARGPLCHPAPARPIPNRESPHRW